MIPVVIRVQCQECEAWTERLVTLDGAYPAVFVDKVMDTMRFTDNSATCKEHS